MKFVNNQLPPQPSANEIPQEFLTDLFGLLEHCLSEPPAIRQEMLHRIYDTLRQQLLRNLQQQEVSKRRIA